MKNARTITPADVSANQLVYVVWEITLRCDHACGHCGSRAARARPDELTTAELLDVARRIVDLGAREVTLIGGEAYLRPDCAELVASLAGSGVKVTMQTGGRGLTPEVCRTLADAGLAAVGVSVDGPAHAHDVLRAARGSHAAALRALASARAVGLLTVSNLQLNALTLPHLREHHEILRAAGVRGWRAQLTVPMGRAADHPEWLLQPWEVLEAIDTLAAIQRDELERVRALGLDDRHALDVSVGNNVGYYGPHEALLRGRPGGEAQFWGGCSAGAHVLGVESDGTIKGCPSLPTAPYAAGNVREVDLAEAWRHDRTLGFTRHRGADELWGFCGTCYYGEVCRGGCSWTSHVTLGRRGNNPFCYHRAETLRAEGRRERIRRVEAAGGKPYDFGRFELIEEPWPT